MQLLSRQQLFTRLDELREQWGCSRFEGIDPFAVAEKIPGISIELINFSDGRLCGILTRFDHTTSIALNRRRSNAQRRFDLCHELVHYFLHERSERALYCLEQPDLQNNSVEWQANEGAAELLMPYRAFIPLAAPHAGRPGLPYISSPGLTERFALRFGVTGAMIDLRFRSLEWQTEQYLQGVSLDSLNLSPNRSIEFFHRSVGGKTIGF